MLFEAYKINLLCNYQKFISRIVPIHSNIYEPPLILQ